VGGRRVWARAGGSVALLVLFVLGALVVTLVAVVHGRLLDDDTYTAALAEHDAYERVYTEVLADPALAELADQLVGDLRIAAVSATQARALATAALRWSVPPSTLQASTEAAIASTLAYIRGDADALAMSVGASAVLARIDDTAVRVASSSLAVSLADAVSTAAAFRDALADLADELAAGRVPDRIPVVGGAALDATAIVDAIVAELAPGADSTLRREILAAVLADDQRDAVITAASAHVTAHAAAAGDRLRAATVAGRLDVVAEVADRADRTRGQVADVLDSARAVARWTRPAVGVAGVALVLLAALGLVWLHRDDPRRAAGIVGAACLLAGATVLLSWLVVRSSVDSPLDRATGSGPDSWDLPAALRVLLADVEGSVGATVAATVRRIVVVFLLTGTVLVAAGATLAILDRPGAVVRRVAPWQLLAGAGGIAALVVVVGLVAHRDADESARACNGHAELCDRRYDEVVYAATHNAMSSPDVVQVWPEHDGDIAAQLDAGVRALLIDTHHWTTLLSSEELTALDPFIRPGIARTVYDGLGPLREEREGTYLCHAHCGLGAMPFVDGLAQVRTFLDANPGEVVTLIIQDAITPEETAADVLAAGLEPYLHAQEEGEPWPTLGELVDAGERLVVFAEVERPPPEWYGNAFEAMQETPFLFTSPERFSCRPNRGDPDAGLFLLNHWVQRVAPARTDAAVVNAFDVLVDRARQCQEERGLLPNFVAVNFYNIGDLMPAVDALNGVG
jgi:hypothetical protein